MMPMTRPGLRALVKSALMPTLSARFTIRGLTVMAAKNP